MHYIDNRATIRKAEDLIKSFHTIGMNGPGDSIADLLYSIKDDQDELEVYRNSCKIEPSILKWLLEHFNGRKSHSDLDGRYFKIESGWDRDRKTFTAQLWNSSPDGRSAVGTARVYYPNSIFSDPSSYNDLEWEPV